MMNSECRPLVPSIKNGMKHWSHLCRRVPSKILYNAQCIAWAHDTPLLNYIKSFSLKTNDCTHTSPNTPAIKKGLKKYIFNMVPVENIPLLTHTCTHNTCTYTVHVGVKPGYYRTLFYLFRILQCFDQHLLNVSHDGCLLLPIQWVFNGIRQRATLQGKMMSLHIARLL